MPQRGPRTEQGKAIIARNAITHGIYAAVPLVHGVEDSERWESHRAGLLQSLAPQDALELALAERVATALWRMGRVVRFEQAAVAQSMAGAVVEWEERENRFLRRSWAAGKGCSFQRIQEFPHHVAEALALLERLPSLPAHQPLPAHLGVLLSRVMDRKGAARGALPSPEEAPLSVAELKRMGGACSPHADWVASAAARLSGILPRARDEAAMATGELGRIESARVLPPHDQAEKVMRYETHLSREFFKALHELEAIQARRAGQVAPLARVEVHSSAADPTG